MNTSSKDIAIALITFVFSLWFGGLVAVNAQNNQIYDGLTPQDAPTNYVEVPSSGSGSNSSQGVVNGNNGQGVGNGNNGQSIGNSNTNSGSFYLQNPLNSKFTTVGGLVEGFMQIFSYIAVLFAVLMLIYVGLQFVLARGKPERLNELKMWLLYIVIGVAIVIGARIIVEVVINTLQATGTLSPGVINNAHNAVSGN